MTLAKQIQVLERADDTMLCVEWKEYLTTMRKVRARMENALLVLPAAPSFFTLFVGPENCIQEPGR
jgi:hypothetical protein